MDQDVALVIFQLNLKWIVGACSLPVHQRTHSLVCKRSEFRQYEEFVRLLRKLVNAVVVFAARDMDAS